MSGLFFVCSRHDGTRPGYGRNSDKPWVRLEFDKRERGMRTMKDIDRLLNGATLIAKSPPFAYVVICVASPVSGLWSR